MGASSLLREDCSPVVLHVDENPTPFGRLVESFVEASNVRVAIVGVFALGISMMNDQSEAGAVFHRGPLEHLKVAIGVAEGNDRAATDEAINADRLARAVVDKIDVRHAIKYRLAVLHFILHLDAASDNLLR